MANFIHQIKKHLSLRFVYGHLFWCQRKGAINSQYKICTPVFKWDSDIKDNLVFTKNYIDFWKDHKEYIFTEKTYFQENKKNTCEYFENVYIPIQFINMFGVISCGIFLNLGKRYFFVGRMNDDEIYRYYAKWTKELFKFTCESINVNHLSKAILCLRPVHDYDSSYFKIVNLKHIDYIESKEKSI